MQTEILENLDPIDQKELGREGLRGQKSSEKAGSGKAYADNEGF